MDSPLPIRVVLVTGPSGAGRTTAVHALEDLGYEAIDNLPFRLVPQLIEGAVGGRRWPLVLMCATGTSRPRP